MPVFEPTTFRTMKLTWTVEGPGSCEIELPPGEPGPEWGPEPKRIVVRGERDWAGEIMNLSRSGGPDESKVGWKASGLGLAHRLDYRVVRHDLVVNDEAAVIVEALLSEAQDNQYNGQMGLQMGDVIGTTVTRLRSYCVGVNIGDAIKELAGVARGFDWDVDADGNLNIWNNTRGVDTGRTLTEEETELFEFELDNSELLTNVTAIADPSDPFGPKYRMSRTAKADNYGRRELSIDTDVVALNEVNADWESELYDAGRALLKTDGGGFLRVHARWNASRAPWSLADVWLQDIVTITLPDIVGGPQDCRVTDVSVTMEAMPPRGTSPPIYWIEYNFDAVVRDLDITDGDPDQES